MFRTPPSHTAGSPKSYWGPLRAPPNFSWSHSHLLPMSPQGTHSPLPWLWGTPLNVCPPHHLFPLPGTATWCWRMSRRCGRRCPRAGRGRKSPNRSTKTATSPKCSCVVTPSLLSCVTPSLLGSRDPPTPCWDPLGLRDPPTTTPRSSIRVFLSSGSRWRPIEPPPISLGLDPPPPQFLTTPPPQALTQGLLP